MWFYTILLLWLLEITERAIKIGQKINARQWIYTDQYKNTTDNVIFLYCLFTFLHPVSVYLASLIYLIFNHAKYKTATMKIHFDKYKIVLTPCMYKTSLQISLRKTNLNEQHAIMELLKFALIYSIMWLPSPNTPPYWAREMLRHCGCMFDFNSLYP